MSLDSFFIKNIKSMHYNTNFYEIDTAPAKSELKTWVNKMASWCGATHIHWCNGSQEEYDMLCEALVEKGTFIRLNSEKRPNSFACFSDPGDVARVEDRTFVCTIRKEDAGPTNN